jgi:hypothetical protein
MQHLWILPGNSHCDSDEVRYFYVSCISTIDMVFDKFKLYLWRSNLPTSQSVMLGGGRPMPSPVSYQLSERSSHNTHRITFHLPIIANALTTTLTTSWVTASADPRGRTQAARPLPLFAKKYLKLTWILMWSGRRPLFPQILDPPLNWYCHPGIRVKFEH